MDINISFEEAIAQLEDLVRKLESGNLTLDDSLTAFEDAVKLVKFCNTKIESAEQKVKILMESADGSVTDVPFDKQDDET